MVQRHPPAAPSLPAGAPESDDRLSEEGRHLPQEDATLSPLSAPPQFFVTTAEARCPYLPDQQERKLVTELHGADAQEDHSRLSRAGFRRSHYYAYRPACRACQACRPVRIAAADFRRSKSQRRLWRRNSDLDVRRRAPQATQEQYELFRRYLLTRHEDGEMAAMSWNDYRRMIEDTAVRTLMIEFRDARGELAAACLTDWLDDGFSAVYSFFDTEEASRGLGNYCILWLVEQCRRH